ncbi:hypothetical protein KDK95_13355 [Actinospica sp. MGRD01-02]|uniref:Uncharacterized protein n=1 Tax=Actinospica acidithermotolerans TaxID=2828514 RepID=A0A941EBA6_9ACTN|nr:hypothetical protein [Actinospica acidithermotolerans]MBR7827298.1 hypothetical protein [Actinospica acidithermotolerans]
MLTRLQMLGFAQITVVLDEKLKFTARKAAAKVAPRNAVAGRGAEDLASSQRADGDE